jgi:hypothetical protein
MLQRYRDLVPGMRIVNEHGICLPRPVTQAVTIPRSSRVLWRCAQKDSVKAALNASAARRWVIISVGITQKRRL